MLSTALLGIAIAGLTAATIYLLLVAAAAQKFRRAKGRRSSGTAAIPPVTLLKPVYGSEPRLRENLESFFRIDYPKYEIVFGTRYADDPALAVVRELRARYPHVRTRIVLAGEPDRPNAKVCALTRMVAAASYELLVISDSDVQVAPNYIEEVTRPLHDPGVGLVTCLYRGVPTGGLWSRLEALGMSVEMTSGVLVADMMEGMKFALGPTMATRKSVLRMLGGVEVLSDYCADDYVLGKLVAAAGLRVVLSDHVIGHVVVGQAMRSSLSHQARWMKSTRFSRPLGHAGSGMTFAMPFGLLGLAAGLSSSHAVLGLSVLALAFGNRIAQALIAGYAVVNDRESLRYCWLYPLRDLLGFLLWSWSFAGGSTIIWRNHRYRLLDGGRMVAVRPAFATPESAFEPQPALVGRDVSSPAEVSQ